MAAYVLYVLRRFGQFVLVVFVGINIAFFVTHATPIDPITAAIAAAQNWRAVAQGISGRRTSESCRSPHGLPVSPPLPPGDGRLPQGAAGAHDARPWTSRRLFLPRALWSSRARAPNATLARSSARSGPGPVSGYLLEVERVTKRLAIGGLFGRGHFNAVDDVSFTVNAGQPEILAIIGESGSGKTTLARMILNTFAPTSGAIRFRGEDLLGLRGRKRRFDFMRQVQPILQNPFEAFNPLKQVDRYLYASAVRFAYAKSEKARDEEVDAALQKVGLSLAEVRGRFPHELSGGQLQRTAVARALISSPALIVADEPVSMVDASLRMSIVNLFKQLRDELQMSLLYITHDLATAYYISDRVIIMHTGRVVERDPHAKSCFTRGTPTQSC
jgi:ABC-type oligopeptide transport system ATPase subunit